MAKDIYGVNEWGDGLITVLENGHIGLCHPDNPEQAPTDLLSLIPTRQRGIETPVLLRITDFLKSRIDEINQSFVAAIAEYDYKGRYQAFFRLR